MLLRLSHALRGVRKSSGLMQSYHNNMLVKVVTGYTTDRQSRLLALLLERVSNYRRSLATRQLGL